LPKQTKKAKKAKKAKQPKKTAKIIVRETALVEPEAEPVQEEEEKVEPYKYEADKVNWSFDGVQRHSTMIFIGNLPNHIKVAAVQFFVMKKAKVTMRQIEETQIRFGGRGKYALVRFRSDVSMNRVNAFVNGVNNENNELFEKQNQERERLMELKSEIRSNSNPTNLEMEDNVSEMTYSSASSVKEPSIEPTKPELEPVPVEVYPNPKPSYPALPKQTKKSNKAKKTKQPKKAAKIIVRETATVEPEAEPVQEEEKKVEPYKYEADKVNWSFDGVQRHSTMIFIGNLPNHIKVAAVQFFVMKKAKVTMRQIEETQIRFGGRGKYALVRFRSDVSMNRVNAFVNGVNNENNELFEKQKKSDNGMAPGKSQKRVSWQKRVFLKFNTTFKYFESEEAMYQDPTARHKLFLRNFDILNEECHKKLTYALLECGDLARDITIRVDRFGDPYCVATFKNIEDAIYCCNSEIVFEGRVLEMKYDKQ